MNIDGVLGKIAGTESGGDYNATNGRTGAAGKYQILPSNWPSWSKEAGLPAGAKMTPANQEKVARFKLSQYVEQFGEQGAAVAWYAGPAAAKAWVKNPNAPRFNKKQGNGNEPSINEYVAMTVGSSGSSTPAPTTAAPQAAKRETVTAQSTPAQVEHYIRTNYPDVASFLDNPDLRRIMFEGAVNDLAPDVVLENLKKTNYWQTNSPSSRAFDELIGRKDGTADVLVENAKGMIADAFSRLGIEADDAKTGDVAKKAIRAGWISLQGQVVNQAKLNDFAAFAIRTAGKPVGGTVAVSADALGKIARDYGVPMSRKALEDAALRILEGSTTEETFKQEVAAKAKGQWQNDPDVIKAIDDGRSVSDFFDSHRQLIADTLELDPEQVDLFNDPRFQQVTQFFDGEKRRAMTLGETALMARKDDRFKQTRAAQQQAADFTMLIKRQFEGVG